MASFQLAVQWMKEGKKVRRKSFINPEFYLYCDKQDRIKQSERNGETTHSNDYIPNLEATDWEIYDDCEKKTTESLSDKLYKPQYLHGKGNIADEKDLKVAVRKILDLNEFGINNKIRAINGKETYGEWFVSIEDFKNKIKEIFGDKLI